MNTTRQRLTRRARRIVGVLIAVAAATIAGAGPVSAVPEERQPEPDFCLQDTTGTLFTTGSSTFGDAPVLSWKVQKGCSLVRVTLAGQTVQTAGSLTVNPSVTTRYTLSATYRGAEKVLGRRTVVAAEAIGYVGLIPEYDLGAAADAVNAKGRLMFETLHESDRYRMVGKVIEVHLVPWDVPVTTLPTFDHLIGEMTDDGTRPWSTVRGGGGVLKAGTNRVVMFVGEEEMVATPRAGTFARGYVFVHEMGHTVLNFLMDPSRADDAWSARRFIGPPWIGYDDAYTSRNAHEYWAEGTAGWFGFDGSGTAANYEEFSRAWLGANDSGLFVRLAYVYGDRD